MKLEYYPESKILITPAQPVPLIDGHIVTGPIPTVAYDMLDFMYESDGIGLSAPQIGVSWRMFVMRLSDGEDKIVINPHIVWVGEDLVTLEEGCLSLPGLYGNVTRPGTIMATYQSLDGMRVIRGFEGMDARVFQHEYDHLDGWLFPFYNIGSAVKGEFKPLQWSLVDELTNNLLEVQKI